LRKESAMMCRPTEPLHDTLRLKQGATGQGAFGHKPDPTSHSETLEQRWAARIAPPAALISPKSFVLKRAAPTSRRVRKPNKARRREPVGLHLIHINLVCDGVKITRRRVQCSPMALGSGLTAFKEALHFFKSRPRPKAAQALHQIYRRTGFNLQVRQDPACQFLPAKGCVGPPLHQAGAAFERSRHALC
jgi:hypothetical protein